MVRLTPELVGRSPQFMNCLGDRELDLRGNQISVIENLATSNDQFDVLDLTDNIIALLANFPHLRRLKTVLAGNNKVARIGAGFAKSLPNLESLVLVGNQLTTLADLDELTKLPKLQSLVLNDNPVTNEKHYRLYLVDKVPSLRVLDFKKIRQEERKAAAELFAGAEGAKLKGKLEKPAANTAKTFVPGELGDVASKQDRPTQEQVAAVKKAIENAKSIDEITQLEKALRQGNIEEVLSRVKT